MSTTTSRPIWMERPTLPGQFTKGLVLVAVTLAVLLPFYVVTLTSLSSRKTVNDAGGLVVVPGEFSFEAYREIFAGGTVLQALLVSVGVTAVGTLLSITLTVLAAYGLSRPGSVAHRPLLFMVLLTLLFAPGIIPSYLMVKGVGLLDSFAALVLPNAVMAFHLIVLRSFFMGIPQEIIDSARVDGAGEFRILAQIVTPLSKAVIAVVALFYGVGYWNAFFNALLYLDDSGKWPLQLVVRTYVLQGSPLPSAEAAATNAVASAPPPVVAVQMAIVVLAILPVLFVYPFVQRHFVKGVIIGAVKG